MVKVLKSSKARAFDAIIMTPATPKQANVKKRFILATPERSGSGCERGQPCSKICRSPPGSLRHHAAGIAREYRMFERLSICLYDKKNG